MSGKITAQKLKVKTTALEWGIRWQISWAPTNILQCINILISENVIYVKLEWIFSNPTQFLWNIVLFQNRQCAIIKRPYLFVEFKFKGFEFDNHVTKPWTQAETLSFVLSWMRTVQSYSCLFDR